jgi:hypothetical protein
VGLAVLSSGDDLTENLLQRSNKVAPAPPEGVRAVVALAPGLKRANTGVGGSGSAGEGKAGGAASPSAKRQQGFGDRLVVSLLNRRQLSTIEEGSREVSYQVGDGCP